MLSIIKLFRKIFNYFRNKYIVLPLSKHSMGKWQTMLHNINTPEVKLIVCLKMVFTEPAKGHGYTYTIACEHHCNVIACERSTSI